MNNIKCPQCGRPNRATARFCVACGANLTGAVPPAGPHPTPAARAAKQARDVAAQAAQAAAPAVQQAAQAATPVAQEAARRSWQGMGWLARLVTGGGRAAYTEIVSPQPALAGQVISQPVEDGVPARIEVGAIGFVLGLALGWLIFLLPQGWQQLAAILILALVLLGLNFAGLRHPAFTRLTWSRLLGRARQVPRLRCQVREHTTNQVIDLALVGPRSGGHLSQGADLLAYGLRDSQTTAMRAWKLELAGAAGPTTIIAPRLVPLTVALMLVPALLGLAWLVEVIVLIL